MESDAELRRQLTEAIARVRHQLEVQRSANGFAYQDVGPSGYASAIDGLERELAELREALSGLRSDDA